MSINMPVRRTGTFFLARVHVCVQEDTKPVPAEAQGWSWQSSWIALGFPGFHLSGLAVQAATISDQHFYMGSRNLNPGPFASVTAALSKIQYDTEANI